MVVAQTPSAAPRTNIGTPDWSVGAGTTIGSTLYVGGQFTQIGTLTGSFAVAEAGSGIPSSITAQVEDGEVLAISPDGSGGWYIAGDFSTVAGQPRPGAARIGSDGALLSWTPSVGGQFRAIAVSGGRVFLGGFGLYALDAATACWRNQLSR
jgi:hypothetical protein